MFTNFEHAVCTCYQTRYVLDDYFSLVCEAECFLLLFYWSWMCWSKSCLYCSSSICIFWFHINLELWKESKSGQCPGDLWISGNYLSIPIYISLYDTGMTCSMSSVSITPDQSTCQNLRHQPLGNIWMSLMFRHPVNHSHIGYMTTGVKYPTVAFELWIFTISTEVSECTFPWAIQKVDRMEKAHTRYDWTYIISICQWKIRKLWRLQG